MWSIAVVIVSIRCAVIACVQVCTVYACSVNTVVIYHT